VTGGQAADAIKEGARGGDVPEGQVRRNCAVIEPSWYRGIGQDRLELASEHEPALRGPVEERLLPEAVPPQHKLPAAVVPDREREHAVEPPCQVHRWRLFRQVRDHLSIALGAELMPAALQLPPELAKVVDLPVEDGRDGIVLVSNRRIARDQVDDREAVLADHAVRSGEATAGVRATVI
jgi:hypothetical protein